MTRPITEIDDPRLVKALAHPLRIRVMGLLEQRSATPKELARVLNVPLENLSYHVRALRSFGFIELEGVRMVRGAVEHRYRLAARPRITAKAWESLPAIVREALDAASLGQIWDLVGRAAVEGKLERPESQMSRRFLRLDAQGFSEVSAIISETMERLIEVERESAERLRQDGHEEIPAYVVAMLFDAPDAVEPSADGTGARVPRRAATADAVS